MKTQYKFNIEISTLKIEDYLIPPDTVIERKTTRDFKLSIVDGRLFNQAFRMARITERSMFIVEGRNYQDVDIDVSIEAVKGALITLAHTFYIPVLRTIDESDTAWYLNQIFEHSQRIGRSKGCKVGCKGKFEKTLKLQLLSSLPGIGNKTAKDLLNYFGTVHNVFEASEKELMQVEGIGKITAKKIKNIVEEDFNEYFY